MSDNGNNTTTSEKFNAEIDAPDLLPIAIESVKGDRGVLNMAVLARLGLQRPAEPVQIEQMLEMSNNAIEHMNKLFEKIDTMMESHQKILYKLENKIEESHDKIKQAERREKEAEKKMEEAKKQSIPKHYKIGSAAAVVISWAVGFLF